jgi:hypothetical protein
MAVIGPRRPSVSRETRLLVATVIISLLALWVLARIRFAEDSATSNLVPPVLTQLTSSGGFEALASVVAGLESRIVPLLVTVDLGASGRNGPNIIAALRIDNERAVTLVGDDGAGALASGANIVARDAASGLTLLRSQADSTGRVTMWVPRRLESPRYLVVAEASRAGVSLRPAFVGALHAVNSPTWSGAIWAMPPNSGVRPGAFLFTTDGALAGLAIERDGRAAIVPGEMVIVAAHRLQQEGGRAAGRLGVDIQRLTPVVAAALGAATGVVVTWVDPKGPAAGQLAAADVVEAVNGEAVEAPEDWRARTARLAAGEAVVLRVRSPPGRAGPAPAAGVREVRLTAAPEPPPPDARPLGLTMRAVPRTGVEVVRVEPGSAAARAGVEAGDIVTLFGDVDAPTPAQVMRAFDGAPDDRPIPVAIARGASHHVLALEKR